MTATGNTVGGIAGLSEYMNHGTLTCNTPVTGGNYVGGMIILVKKTEIWQELLVISKKEQKKAYFCKLEI